MSITPLRNQYLKIKQRYPDAIVFFRLGDFYETFDEDARLTAKVLEITLTSREMGKGNRVPLAGIPYHAVDNYLAKLIKNGYKVAICEQLTPPGNGLVDRDVIRIVTPGTVLESNLLNEKSNNYLIAILTDVDNAGIAYIDISTGEFATTELPVFALTDEITRLNPAEILVAKSQTLGDMPVSALVTRLDDIWFEYDTAKQVMIDHFNVATLDCYGCTNYPLAIRAAGAVLSYIKETQKSILNQINKLSTYSCTSFMVLDAQTRRNLDLFDSGRAVNYSDTLCSTIDLTVTAMGGRLLKKWLGQPLLDINRITNRQDTVEWFYSNLLARQAILKLTNGIADIERIVSRIKSNRANVRDLNALRNSLEQIPQIKDCLSDAGALTEVVSQLKDCPETVDLIAHAITDNDVNADLESGGVIKEGFSAELDELRGTIADAKKYIANLEKSEREKTKIKSLKVSYNRVFGYFIEVSNANLGMVPESYIRKQTLSYAERYFTPELKEFEAIVFNAQEKITEIETMIFGQICSQIAADSERILDSAQTVAQLDVYISLASVAERYKYIRPEITSDNVLSISGGRHPVIEKNIGRELFVPNDTLLDPEANQIIILTGPNMAGKSTYIKQVALIVLLSQVGSFVPAEKARLGIIDRIFTRIGAQEDLVAGKSTFMVEMMETANILHNATAQSLVILDEVGRGTSTYDGLSIAWSVIEYLHNNPKIKAKTLFATHYHELVGLADVFPGVKNCNIIVSDEKGKVIFLHKVLPGGADKSYGIHVAKMAGLPQPVIKRAESILKTLESEHQPKQIAGDRISHNNRMVQKQLDLFNSDSRLIQEIIDIDINSISPLEAITKLYELQSKAKKDKVS